MPIANASLSEGDLPRSASTPLPRHPNSVDRKRIERALARRSRYRYVSPRVCPVPNGYAIVSSCCSRNVDPSGGEIEIAFVEFVSPGARWRLHGRDHVSRTWIPYGEYATLPASLEPLLADPHRRFWR